MTLSNSSTFPPEAFPSPHQIVYGKMPVKTAPMTIAITTVNRPEFLRESIA
jgi:hypothetical protein